MTAATIRTYINNNRKFIKVYNIGHDAGIPKNRMTLFLIGAKLRTDELHRLEKTLKKFQL